MGKEAKSTVIKADMICQVIIFVVPDAICFLRLTILWINCDEAGEGIREVRQGLMVGEVGVREDKILRQLSKIRS